MTSDDDEYRYHGDVYYEKQWDLLDERLSKEHARLVKRIIKPGEKKRGWIKVPYGIICEISGISSHIVMSEMT